MGYYRIGIIRKPYYLFQIKNSMITLKQIYSITLALGLIYVIPSYSQEYIIFKKQKGFNKTAVLREIDLSQNYVQSEFPDTIIDIYNYYFTSNHDVLPQLGSFEIEQQNSQLTHLAVDFVVSAVVARKTGTDVSTKVLSKDEVSKLNVFSQQQFLETFYAKAKHQMGSRKPGMPFNRTLEYKLIIHDGDRYLLIDQPVLLTWYLVCATDWYFPNQFQAGVLNASPKFVKFYRLSDFTKIISESPYKVLKQFHDRVYPFKKDDVNDFGFSLFSYWEYLNADAGYMISSLFYKNYHLGLGTFTLLPKVGIVSCSLRSSILETNMPTDISNHKILAINGVKPIEFKQLLQKYVYNRTIWGGH